MLLQVTSSRLHLFFKAFSRGMLSLRYLDIFICHRWIFKVLQEIKWNINLECKPYAIIRSYCLIFTTRASFLNQLVLCYVFVLFLNEFILCLRLLFVSHKCFIFL